MTHITADDLEIDVRDTTQLEKVRAEMVRRHENDLERAAQRIAELEAQLATERESKMHETERAQALMRERDAAREETEQAQGHAVAYLHRANKAEQDAWALAFSYNQLYITSDLGGWRGEILERLWLAYQIACKYLKDGEQ